MATLNIPKRVRIGLAKFLSLADETVQTLISALKNAPLALEVRETLKGVISSVEAVPRGDVTSITDALAALYLVRNNRAESVSEFIEGIERAIERNDYEDLKLSDEMRANIKPRLGQLLEVDSFVAATEAQNAIQDSENVFFTARVLTDIRPVFGLNPDSPQAAIVIHTLKIHYHQEDQHKNFFLTVDTQDIQKLIDVLERAKVKAFSLKSVLAASKIPYIEPE